MTLQVVLTVIEILALVLVLAYFLNRVSAQLRSISATLAKVAFGVRAVETQALVIGPAADRLNRELDDAVAGLQQAATLAERKASR